MALPRCVLEKSLTPTLLEMSIYRNNPTPAPSLNECDGDLSLVT
jgi:hypothetical protein